MRKLDVGIGFIEEGDGWNWVMSKRFVPDERNIGGRKTISDQMANHLLTLLTIKPTLHTRSPRPSRPKPHFHPSPPMSEVYETFRRSAKASHSGSGIDQSPPHTFSMSQKLSRARAKKRTNGMSEHWNNVKHMLRRIKALGTTTERRKNQFDPFIHPSLFFRRSCDARSWKEDPRLRSLMSRSVRSSRPQTAKSGTSVSVSIASAITPHIDPMDPDPSLTLKQQLMDTIITHRIYQDKDLEALFSRTKAENWFLGAEVQNAIDYIRRQLDE